jgi:hypothetical protein
MGAPVGDRMAEGMTQTCQFERVLRVLEILETGDDPRYVFRLHGTGTVSGVSPGSSATIESFENPRR